MAGLVANGSENMSGGFEVIEAQFEIPYGHRYDGPNNWPTPIVGRSSGVKS